MFSQAWQLAVVDYSLVKNNYHKLCPQFSIAVEKSKHIKNALADGEIVFIVCAHEQQYNIEEYKNPVRARVWIPRIKKYGFCLLDMLYPVLSEKDAIDLELRLGVNLDDFVRDCT